jgi:predicted transcriptional regulator
MPRALVVVRWDDRVGTVVEASYPKDVPELTPDLTMKIYGTHTLGKDLPTPDFLVAKMENLNIASFYGGLAIQHFVLLLLEQDEKSELYEDPLMEISFQIFENIENKKYKETIKEVFEHLERYASMTDEQKLALFLSDPNRFAVLDRLVIDGSVTKTELAEYVKKKTGRSLEIDVSLAQLVKFGLVQTEWVEGLSSESVFLMRDVFPMRMPPKTIVEKAKKGLVPKEVAARYLSEVQDFFRDYADRLAGSLEWLNQEAPLVLWAVQDRNVGNIVQVLHNDALKVDELQGQIKASEKAFNKSLSELVNAEFVTLIKDDRGTEYALLKSEPRIISTYPDYTVNTVVDLYNKGLMPPPQVTRYLTVLEENYPKGE